MKVLKDSIIYLAGELFAKSLPFLMLPYLTRKLGPDGFGELSYYLTWLALFGVFVGLSQEGAVTRYYYFYGKKALNTIVKAGYLYNICISLILLVVCWILKAEIMVYVVLACMFQSFVNVQLALRQCQKQPLKYISIQIILSLTNVLFTIAALEYFSDNLVTYRILAIVISNGVTFFIASIVLGNLLSDKYRFTFNRMKLSIFYILSFGAPLILHQASFFIKGQLDRLFIYEQYTKAELGVYTAGVQIASILPILIMAINKAIIPYYYQGLRDKKISLINLKKYTLYSFPISLVPAIVAAFIPVSLIQWFLGQQYQGSKYFIVIYLAGYGLTIPYLVLVNYLFFHGKTKVITSITFFTSLIYLALLVFTSNISVVYIPYSLLVSNLLMVIVLWVAVSRCKII